MLHIRGSCVEYVDALHEIGLEMTQMSVLERERESWIATIVEKMVEYRFK